MVARSLRELGILLEAGGRDPRRARSYQTAARVIERAGDELATRAAAGTLEELDGVGPRIAAAVTTLLDTGTLPELETLRSRLPPALLARLHEDLDPATVDRIRLDQADALAARLLPAVLDRAPALLSPTGALRRRAEIVHHLTLLAGADHAGPLLDRFASQEGAGEVVTRRADRVTVRPPASPPVTLRVVPADRFVPALVHDTGSPAHLELLSTRLAAGGHHLGEDGLHRDGAPVAVGSEAELYARAGLHWMPPEAREVADEGARYDLDARPPRLVEIDDVIGIVHVHSTWSDGKDDLVTLVQAARARKARYLVITDHSQAAAYAGGLDRGRLAHQRAEIRRIAARVDDLTLLQGVEADILPDGRLDLDDATLDGLDVVIGSLHAALDQDRDTLHRRLERAFENPRLQILGHPSTRRLLERAPAALDLDRVAELAHERGVTLEINGYPRRLDASWELVRRHRESGLRFVVGADAHAASQLEHVRYGVEVARRAGLGPDAVLNTRPVEELLTALERAPGSPS